MRGSAGAFRAAMAAAPSSRVTPCAAPLCSSLLASSRLTAVSAAPSVGSVSPIVASMAALRAFSSQVSAAVESASATSASSTSDVSPPPPPPSAMPSNVRFSDADVLDDTEDEELDFIYVVAPGPKSAPLYKFTADLSLERAGDFALNDFVFSTEVRQDIIHNVVAWQRASRRRGLAKRKDRSEVSGSTRKPFRQKGTGKARQGSTRGPHMRGGAVALAPKGNQDFSYKLNKKYRRFGLRSVLSARLIEENLVVVDSFAAPADSEDFVKTKQIAAMIQDQEWDSVLFVDGDDMNEEFKRAVSNIPNAHVLPQVGLNVYDILSFKKLVISTQALEELDRRLDENVRKTYFSR